MKQLVIFLGVLLLTTPVFAKEAIMCTMEAKQCPDGSYVSRQGPSCEFALCPDIQEEKPAEPPVYISLILERVVDGDTIVASGKKIRLWGINTPEKNEPLYEEASLALKIFLEVGELSCKQIEKDKYERDIMHCLVSGADLGSLMVKSGWAHDYKKYSGGFYQGEQQFAKESMLGIWKSQQ